MTLKIERREGAHAINVKHYHACDAEGGTDDQRARAYERAQHSWWANARLIAQSHGYADVGGAGRSGGWLVVLDSPTTLAEREEEPSDNFHKFADAIERLHKNAPKVFADTLAEVIAEDAPDSSGDYAAFASQRYDALARYSALYERREGEPTGLFVNRCVELDSSDAPDSWVFSREWARARSLAGRVHDTADALQAVHLEPGFHVARELRADALGALRALADDIEQCPQQYGEEVNERGAQSPGLAFTPQECATLIAALRMYQDRETGDSPGDDYADIARSAGEPLDIYSGIDSLCEKARAMSGTSPRGDMVPELVAALRAAYGTLAWYGENAGTEGDGPPVGDDDDRELAKRIADVLARWDEGGPLESGPFILAAHSLIERAEEAANLLRERAERRSGEDAADGLDHAREALALLVAAPAPTVYTLDQLRRATGDAMPRNARFVMVTP